ncbi:DUF3037 domain-containing protein [Sphingobium indicum]|uniref:DUF3037 domain-containing protein n=1 Tax=Sphingobium indicum TaxID=332055 RepID=UPI0009DB1F11|nr:DUF3037 domain-containing protein [Sphingobium indicum]
MTFLLIAMAVGGLIGSSSCAKGLRMVRSYKFAIVRLAPGGVRDERINVGVVVFGEASIDVRLPKRLDKIRVLSSAIDQSSIRELTEAVVARDIDIRNAGIFDPEARNTAIYEASSNVESAARSCLETAAHQGAELINWASNSDKIKLITSIASLATPIEKSRDRNRRPHEDTPRLKLA